MKQSFMNIIWSLLFVKLFICTLFLISIAPANAQNTPPKARVEDVSDEYFGVKITDPYRWMENSKSDEVQKWMKAQATYADAYLQKLPMRGDIFEKA